MEYVSSHILPILTTFGSLTTILAMGRFVILSFGLQLEDLNTSVLLSASMYASCQGTADGADFCQVCLPLLLSQSVCERSRSPQLPMFVGKRGTAKISLAWPGPYQPDSNAIHSVF